jgi:hypothetical protein
VVKIENLSDNPGASRQPDLACDQDGNLAVAWTDDDSGRDEVWFREKMVVGSWTPVRILSSLTEYARAPSLCFGPDGTLHAVWSQSSGPDWCIVHAERRPGADWSVPETIRYGVAVQPVVRTDDLGRVHLLFEDIGMGANVCYCLRDTNRLWGSVEVVQDGYVAQEITLLTERDGYCVAAWVNKLHYHVYCAERQIGASWTSPRDISESFPFCREPTLVGRGDNVALAFLDAGKIPVMRRLSQGDWVLQDTVCPSELPYALSGVFDRQGSLWLAYGDYPKLLRLARFDAGSWASGKLDDSLAWVATRLRIVEGGGTFHLAWEYRKDTLPEEVMFASIDSATLSQIVAR